MCVYAVLHMLRRAKPRVLSKKLNFCDYIGHWPASSTELNLFYLELMVKHPLTSQRTEEGLQQYYRESSLK